MNRRAHGLDASQQAFPWSVDTSGSKKDGQSSYCWKDSTVSLFPDHPYLRSAPNPMTGEETRWYIPTIIRINETFGYRPKKGESVSTRTLWMKERGICQYCFTKIPLSEATKDHVYPQSLGGTHHDFNLVLACRPCNSKKDSIYPYFDANGNLPKGTSIHDYLSYMYEGVEIRDEMCDFLYREKKSA